MASLPRRHAKNPLETVDMSYELLKQQAAFAALAYLKPGQIIGVGTGSTVHYFIEALVTAQLNCRGAIASSEATATHLKAKGVSLTALNEVEGLPIYIDSADYINKHFHLIKGGGGALTREKILAYASHQFICIADHSKFITNLDENNYPPVPIEVLPMARTFVEKAVRKLGGDPHYRPSFVTDNGNIILDVKGLNYNSLLHLECTLNQIPGTIANGLFTQRRPDIVLLATPQGIQTLTAPQISRR